MFYAPSHDTQRPTHNRLHVRDARDAQTVFEAVRVGKLRPVARRLNEIERATCIQSGALFVWEESDDELGLKRWTDGRVWSQSRMREPFLFYDERLSGDDSDHAAEQQSRSQAVYRFVDGTSRKSGSSSILSHFDRTANRPQGLVKQAYSAWVSTTPTSKPRKWHLTAYFTYADLQNLPTIDRDPMLHSISVPPGVYRSGKARSKSDLMVDTSQGSATSSASSSPPQTPSALRGLGPTQSTPRSLPPLLATVAQDGLPNHMAHLHRDLRFSEDQRMIQMLNSRHIR